MLRRVLAVALVSVLALATAALAAERVCRGTIGARTVDNVRVPQGATCTLQSDGFARIVSSRINGDLQFESNDALIVAHNNTIGVNLQAVQNKGGVGLKRNNIDSREPAVQGEQPATDRWRQYGRRQRRPVRRALA